MVGCSLFLLLIPHSKPDSLPPFTPNLEHSNRASGSDLEEEIARFYLLTLPAHQVNFYRATTEITLS